ncbi:Uncharacterised protein [Vibrio cholerae]|nr:Uncharacterised protein [Vibrio cholerae]
MLANLIIAVNNRLFEQFNRPFLIVHFNVDFGQIQLTSCFRTTIHINISNITNHIRKLIQTHIKLKLLFIRI